MLLWYGGRGAARMAFDVRTRAWGRGHAVAGRVVVGASSAGGHWRSGAVVVVVRHVAWGRRGVLRRVHVGDVGLGGVAVERGGCWKGIEPRPVPAHRGMRKPRAVLRVRSQKRVGVEVRAAAQEEQRKTRV
jgi:hypothetical protein